MAMLAMQMKVFFERSESFDKPTFQFVVDAKVPSNMFQEHTLAVRMKNVRCGSQLPAFTSLMDRQQAKLFKGSYVFQDQKP